MAATERGESVAVTDARAGGRTALWKRHSFDGGDATMIHPDIQAALFRERSTALLAAAAAYRRGRQVRLSERSRRIRAPRELIAAIRAGRDAR